MRSSYSIRSTTCGALSPPSIAVPWASAMMSTRSPCASASRRSGKRPTRGFPAPSRGSRRKTATSNLAPVEAVILRGEADPALGAVERDGERGAHDLGLVVLLREMRADDVLQARAVERGEQARGLLVVEVAERTRDALFQPARIAAGPQHVAVVVAFEHQRVEAGKRLLDVTGADADFGQHAELRGAIRYDVLHRLGGIVRHGERAHLHAADGALP